MRSVAYLAAALLAGGAQAQSASASCSSTLSAKYPAPSVAEGYVARLVANGLSSPRGIKFDSEGALLVVESETGITALTFEYGKGGCISESDRQTVIKDNTLNHGIEISFDGKTLYASSSSAAYSWDYSASQQTNTSEPTELVTGMDNPDHTTRTLLLSHSAPGLLLVSRGSNANHDQATREISSGRSMVKAFNLTNMTDTAYDFVTDGLLLGWGLRNDVGVAEHPETGGIYTVENSVDEMHVNGKDIHQTNPGEELNYLGYLNGTGLGRNFGYPECFAAWDVDSIPGFEGDVGEQFAIRYSANNSLCTASEVQAPRSIFHPHMAPLDIKFNDAGTAAWVSFHGSWDSEPPVGYKVSVVMFENGEPVEPSNSLEAAIDIVSNADVTKCEDVSCFRPAGLAFDQDGNLFMSSDETGEIYAILRSDGTATSSQNMTGTVVGSSLTTGGTGGGGGGGAAGGGGGSSSSLASATSFSVLAVVFGVLAFVL